MSETKKCECGGQANFNRNCAADICCKCGNHLGLARCFCGWSLSGRNGYQELLEMGEIIEPEDY
jgi:hypothetical protein